MQRQKLLWFMLLLLGLGTISVSIGAQEENACPTIVQTAIQTTGTVCQTIGRNQLCYGNGQIEATAREGVTDFTLGQAGDVANVADLQTLRLYPLNTTAGTWGVALMRIQANIPGAMPGENVTFVLFGDVQVNNLGDPNAVVEAPPVTLNITADGINLRTGPSTDYGVYTNFSGPAVVDGRTEDGSWLRLRAPGGTEYVWVSASVITVEGDVMTLPVVEATAVENLPSLRSDTVGQINVYSRPDTNAEVRGGIEGTIYLDGRTADGLWLRTTWSSDGSYVWVLAEGITAQGDITTLAVIETESLAPVFGPMQAFVFRGGVGESACAEAPESGILVQTPQGFGQIVLNVNGIDFSFGSTGFFSGVDGQANSQLDQLPLSRDPEHPPFNLTLFNGSVSYSGNYLDPGQSQTFGWNGSAYTYVGDPFTFDPTQYNNLPFSLLPDPITTQQSGTYPVGNWQINYDYFTPPSTAPFNKCAAVLLHNYGMDRTSWSWLTPNLLNSGWSVFAPDMPGHGSTTGPEDPAAWSSLATEFAGYLQSNYGYNCGVFFGSSIGANAALSACSYMPGWCLGAIAYSPGFYGDNTALEAMQNLGNTPVYITASTNDSGANVSQTQPIVDAGSNVTFQTYDSDSHGYFLNDQYDLWGDMSPWWNSSIVPNLPPISSYTSHSRPSCLCLLYGFLYEMSECPHSGVFGNLFFMVMGIMAENMRAGW